MLKKSVFALLALMLLIAPVMVGAQDGFAVDCGNGTTFENGIEVKIVAAREGITYRATVIGLDSFDPIVAVIDSEGNGTCNDDGENVTDYGANLPTTGEVTASSLSSQIDFEQTRGNDGAPLSVIVGGYGNSTGGFLLLIEGLEIDGSEDNGGNAIAINLTNPLVNSGVPLTMYMVSFENTLDDAIYMTNSDGSFFEDASGQQVSCDDAGNENLCYGDSVSLDGSTLTFQSGTLGANSLDSMLSLVIDGLEPSSDPSQNYFNFLFSSTDQQAEGEYIAAFHMSIGESSGGSGGAPPRNPPGGGATPTAAPAGSGGAPPRNPPGGGNAGGDEVAGGFEVNCDNGTTFTNGVQVIVNQMRSGFTYTATAVGLNGFDPVLAVIDPNGNGLCSDDETGAGRYAANLPTTGSVAASGFSSQVMFDQNSAEAFADVSLVVGGFGDQTGEFLLILEGMAVTPGDVGGDVFSVQVTQQMLNSGVPLSVYMMSRGTSRVDPFITLVDSSNDPIQDGDGNEVYCDDAGNAGLCFGDSVALEDYTVTINTGTLPGWGLDSMLSLPLDAFSLTAGEVNYLHYRMSSYGSSEGQYLLVFHMGTSD